MHNKPKVVIPDPVNLTKDYYKSKERTIKRENHPLEDKKRKNEELIDKIMVGDSTINPNYQALHQYKKEKKAIRKESKHFTSISMSNRVSNGRDQYQWIEVES